MSRSGLFIGLCIVSQISISHATDFTQCKANLINRLTQNGTVTLNTNATILTPGFIDPVYHGLIYGLRPGVDRPIEITKAGCLQECGSGPDYNETYQIIQILTTWVLPVLALVGQLPYEALSRRKRQNLEAFINWVGSPAAALTTTMWNMRMIGRLAHLCTMSNPVHRDVYYILSCINQYLYPRGNPVQYLRRDRALLLGILFPFMDESKLPPQAREQLSDLAAILAKQLRLQRRKGVYPISLSVLLFLAAFVISIVLAFAQLGDNTTAHSLALGLLLSWMPNMVVASITDRNPVSSTRCRILIERWLFNVFAVLDGNMATQVDAENPDQQMQRDIAEMWSGEENTEAFSIGDFVGQGRKLRYCGVSDTILDMIESCDGTICFDKDAAFPQDKDAKRFRRRLPQRPWSWYRICFLSQMMIAIPFATALAVSYMTPTIGLGCRSLSYLIWFVLSSCTWLILLFFQEPVKARIFAWLPSALAVVALMVIMAAQISGAFNTCTCKASIFGSGSMGGYMDFENAQFYHDAYNVKLVWAIATATGLLSSSSAIVWFTRRWNRDSILWRVIEDGVPKLSSDISLNWLA